MFRVPILSVGSTALPRLQSTPARIARVPNNRSPSLSPVDPGFSFQENGQISKYMTEVPKLTRLNLEHFLGMFEFHINVLKLL
jgi:hypothetical protein